MKIKFALSRSSPHLFSLDSAACMCSYYVYTGSEKVDLGLDQQGLASHNLLGTYVPTYTRSVNGSNHRGGIGRRIHGQKMYVCMLYNFHNLIFPNAMVLVRRCVRALAAQCIRLLALNISKRLDDKEGELYLINGLARNKDSGQGWLAKHFRMYYVRSNSCSIVSSCPPVCSMF